MYIWIDVYAHRDIYICIYIYIYIFFSCLVICMYTYKEILCMRTDTPVSIIWKNKDRKLSIYVYIPIYRHIYIYICIYRARTQQHSAAPRSWKSTSAPRLSRSWAISVVPPRVAMAAQSAFPSAAGRGRDQAARAWAAAEGEQLCSRFLVAAGLYIHICHIYIYMHLCTCIHIYINKYIYMLPPMRLHFPIFTGR